MPKYELSFRLRFMVRVLRLIRKPPHSLSLKQIQKIRKPFPIGFLARWILGRGPELHDVQDSHIPARDGFPIPVRIYRPSAAKGLPLILNFHGGGWVLGNLQQADTYCRKLAKSCEAVVISVDYRLAPENKFPIPLHDCYDSLLHAHQEAEALGIDPNRIAVTGDSAGGNLSASVSLMSRDLNGPPVAFQALVYPATNGKLDYPSYEVHTHAPILRKTEVDFFLKSYKKDPNDHLNPYFSPYLAENLSNLPPALILTAGYDPIHDDGQMYAERLSKEGNQVEYVDYPKEIHGFITLANHSPSNGEAIALICDRIRKAFSQ